MTERPRPDLDQVRKEMRERDEEIAPAEPDEREDDEREDDGSDDES